MSEVQAGSARPSRWSSIRFHIRYFFNNLGENRRRHREVLKAVAKIRFATEAELRSLEVPWPRRENDLLLIIRTLAKRDHDYGTCVYAMSIASVATFNYISHKLGVTGFQASCADLNILARTRHMKQGFRLFDYNNLLYPQYREKCAEFDWERLISENKDSLRKAANILLIENPEAHHEVKAHWERLASA